MLSLTTILLGIHLLVSQDLRRPRPFVGVRRCPGRLSPFPVRSVSARAIRQPCLASHPARPRSTRGAGAASSQYAFRFPAHAEPGNDRVPLPLTPELWTDVILETSPKNRSGLRKKIASASSATRPPISRRGGAGGDGRAVAEVCEPMMGRSTRASDSE